MRIFYAAVKGDPLDSGGEVAEGGFGEIEGDDGQVRPFAYLGQKALCTQCGTLGSISAAPGSPSKQRITDKRNGRTQALSGDLIFCKCKRTPQIVPKHGKRWRVEFHPDDATPSTSIRTQTTDARAPTTETSAPPASSRRVYVYDSVSGQALSNRKFIATVSGAAQYGRTDQYGFATIYTSRDETISVHVLFSSPKRTLRPE